jgi:DNA polymerase III epsilon subunit-like protein
VNSENPAPSPTPAAAPTVRNTRLFFFDSETGGLSPAEADMVEVACILTDPTGQHILDEYQARIFPTKPVHPKAAAVNGYTVEKWASTAIDPVKAMHELMHRSQNAMFAAHNAAFDWGFFEPLMRQAGRRWQGDYHKLDTCALAMPLYMSCKIPNLKLETLAAYFGIDPGEPHRAMSDVRTCRQVYLRLMKMFTC